MYRVIQAMGYQPGDEAYARKFGEPHPALLHDGGLLRLG
jgi:hypothetical protein